MDEYSSRSRVALGFGAGASFLPVRRGTFVEIPILPFLWVN